MMSKGMFKVLFGARRREEAEEEKLLANLGSTREGEAAVREGDAAGKEGGDDA